MKIILTAIIKGDSEYERVEEMLSSFMPYMSGLVVAITGLGEKKQKIKGLVKKYKGHVIITDPSTHPQLYSKDDRGEFFSNFAEARNITFKYADENLEADWYSWADADDVLVGGEKLKEIGEKAISLKIDRVFFTYWYALKIRADKTFDESCVMIEHDRERLIRPKVFHWVSRIHEVTVPKDQNYKSVDAPYRYDPKENQFTVWAHLTEEKRALSAMDRNIRILEMQAKEQDHKDPRTLFYLAKTYYDLNTKEKDELALFMLQEYLKLSGWPQERANALEYVSNIMSRRGRHKDAVEALHAAIREHPDRHMFYLLLAREYAEIGLTEQSDFWLEVAIRMDPPQSQTTIGNPLEIKFMAASLKANQAIRQVKLEEAIKWMKVRNEIGQLKDDPALKGLEKAKELNDAGIWAFNFAKWLKKRGYTQNIRDLLKALPTELGREPFAAYIAQEVAEPKVWPKKSIAYIASWGAQHFEKWSPKNLETGIGGSETAVIELCKRWAKKGYDVTVYGDPREDAGDYEGVHYRPYYEINWNDTFDTVIYWRTPNALDRKIKANKVLYDAHDVESNLNWTPERIERVDRVFFKSKFHRSMCPNIPDSKVAVISNGL